MKFILLLTLVVIPQIVFAAESGSIESTIFNLIDFIVTIGVAIMGMGGMFISWLLSPDWINGTLFGMETIIKNLWILVSNFVYFFFAFLLIVIAFMNIIGKEGENFQLKTALPRFVVGILIVPFTWFIVQFVVSVSSVLTASVIQLPADLFSAAKSGAISEPIIPKNCVIDLNKTKTSEGQGKEPKVTDIIDCDKSEKISIIDLVSTTPYGIISAYSYDLFGFQDINKIWLEDFKKTNVSDVVSLLFFIIFKLIFFVVYILLIIALIMALFTRVIRIWVFMIFSPLFGLLYYLKTPPETLKKFSFTQFLSLAMVPVYVAAALSFGVFFLKQIQEGITKMSANKDQTTQSIFGIKKEGEEDPIWKISINNETLLTIKGGAMLQKGASKTGVELGNLLGPIGTIIINMIGLCVVWISVMAALRTSEITKEITEPIYKFGANIGNFMKSLPQYAPIPGVGLSAQGLSTVSTYPSSALSSKTANQAGRFRDPIERALGANKKDDNNNNNNNNNNNGQGAGNNQSPPITIPSIKDKIEKDKNKGKGKQDSEEIKKRAKELGDLIKKYGYTDEIKKMMEDFTGLLDTNQQREDFNTNIGTDVNGGEAVLNNKGEVSSTIKANHKPKIVVKVDDKTDYTFNDDAELNNLKGKMKSIKDNAQITDKLNAIKKDKPISEYLTRNGIKTDGEIQAFYDNLTQ